MSEHLSILNVKLLLWNVWSVQGEVKLQKLLDFLLDNSIHLACICETWFSSATGRFSAVIKECGFNVHHAFRAEKNGGGVAIFYKFNMNVVTGEASTTQYLSFEYCTVMLRSDNNKTLIVCLYRKQEQSFPTFLSELEYFIDSHFNKADTIIITGDFNVWVDFPKDSKSISLLNLMNSYGLTQSVNESTHRAGHTLDQVYANPFQLNLNVTVLSDKFDISTDHLPIIVDIPVTAKFSNNQKTIQYRKMKSIDMDSFKTDLQNILDGEDFSDLTFFESYILIKISCQIIIDKHAPLKTRCASDRKLPAWIDNSFLEARRKRRRLEKV